MADASCQLGLDWSPRPPAPTRRARPARPPQDRVVEERLVLALRLLLEARHVGREHAATWEELRQELNAEGAGVEGGLRVTQVRRLQEAKDVLLDAGVPVVALSDSGVFIARTAAEVALALAETEKRARRQLTHRKRLRRAFRELLGQERLAAPIDDGGAP